MNDTGFAKYGECILHRSRRYACLAVNLFYRHIDVIDNFPQYTFNIPLNILAQARQHQTESLICRGNFFICRGNFFICRGNFFICRGNFSLCRGNFFGKRTEKRDGNCIMSG